MKKPMIGDEGVYDIGVFNEIISGLPPEQQPDFIFYIANLTGLSSLLNDFCTAESLFQLIEMHEKQLEKDAHILNKLNYTKTYQSIQSWKNISARDAAMTVYHIQTTIDYLIKSLNNIPYLNDIKSKFQLDEAQISLNEHFPDAKALRHAVGHRSELTSSRSELKRHLVDGKFMLPQISGRDYLITYKKKHRSLSISKENHKKLAEIIQLVHSSFPNIADKLPPILIPSLY